MKLCHFLLLILFFASPLEAQSISGRVTTDSGDAIAYVNIGIVGENIGTISTINGHYTLDISHVNDKEILVFSCVGYHFQSYKIENLKDDNRPLNIILKAKEHNLKEVTVIPKTKPYIIGAKRKSVISHPFNNATKGMELSSVFSCTDSLILKEFSFHISKNTCDSILFRINIYDYQESTYTDIINGIKYKPDSIINTRNILYCTGKKTGWKHIDLSPYHIEVNSDFAISVETINSWSSEENKTAKISLGTKKGLSYFKTKSHSRWSAFIDELNFKVKVIEK